jgi:CheY-like chemotaxis protein/anti-sigma regulatory factor (Ser/Thr protein kinase)
MACLLVVDDDAINLEIIAEFLGEMSPELVFASNGLQAWEQLEVTSERFDAVILDRVMPQMDGMEVLRRIKADARFKTLPVIMQTASSAPAEVAEGLAAGAWYYLAKPYSELALKSIVRAALADRQNRMELARMGVEMQGVLGLTHQALFRFRLPQEARLLAAVLAKLCPNEAAVAMGLSELMLNAIEHGNLSIGYQEKSQLVESGAWQEEVECRLASPEQALRWAVLEYTREADRLCFIIRDQGNGFNWESYLELDPARAFDSHGRGIALARQFCFSSVEYLGRGNVVRTTVSLHDQASV